MVDRGAETPSQESPAARKRGDTERTMKWGRPPRRIAQLVTVQPWRPQRTLDGARTPRTALLPPRSGVRLGSTSSLALKGLLRNCFMGPLHFMTRNREKPPPKAEKSRKEGQGRCGLWQRSGLSEHKARRSRNGVGKGLCVCESVEAWRQETRRMRSRAGGKGDVSSVGVARAQHCCRDVACSK